MKSLDMVCHVKSSHESQNQLRLLTVVLAAMVLTWRASYTSFWLWSIQKFLYGITHCIQLLPFKTFVEIVQTIINEAYFIVQPSSYNELHAVNTGVNCPYHTIIVFAIITKFSLNIMSVIKHNKLSKVLNHPKVLIQLRDLILKIFLNFLKFSFTTLYSLEIVWLLSMVLQFVLLYVAVQSWKCWRCSLKCFFLN